MTRIVPRPRTLRGAVAAGVLAGISIVTCIAVLDAIVLHQAVSLAALFAFDASVLVGKVAYTGGGFIALGVVLHVLVSIGWAIGYAYLAERQPQLVSRPVISGAGFGVVVYFAMQLVLVAANLYHTPTPGELGISLLAHLGFYGIPVALVVARSQQAA